MFPNYLLPHPSFTSFKVCHLSHTHTRVQPEAEEVDSTTIIIFLRKKTSGWDYLERIVRLLNEIQLLCKAVHPV
jgi:hypothetical protein